MCKPWEASHEEGASERSLLQELPLLPWETIYDLQEWVEQKSPQVVFGDGVYHSSGKQTGATHGRKNEHKKTSEDMERGYTPFLPFLIVWIFSMCRFQYFNNKLIQDSMPKYVKIKWRLKKFIPYVLFMGDKGAGVWVQGLRLAKHTCYHWVILGSHVAQAGPRGQVYSLPGNSSFSGELFHFQMFVNVNYLQADQLSWGPKEPLDNLIVVRRPERATRSRALETRSCSHSCPGMTVPCSLLSSHCEHPLLFLCVAHRLAYAHTGGVWILFLNPIACTALEKGTATETETLLLWSSLSLSQLLLSVSPLAHPGSPWSAGQEVLSWHGCAYLTRLLIVQSLEHWGSFLLAVRQTDWCLF